MNTVQLHLQALELTEKHEKHILQLTTNCN